MTPGGPESDLAHRGQARERPPDRGGEAGSGIDGEPRKQAAQAAQAGVDSLSSHRTHTSRPTNSGGAE